MKKEVMEKWVAALRSGEYQQGITHLNRAYQKFCCLGVLCELAIKDGLNVNVTKDNGIHTIYYDNCSSLLPISVVNYAGFARGNINGQFKDSPIKHISHLNDDGYSFEEIATIIEENWEKL